MTARRPPSHDLRLPNYTLVSASAGSGKTTALTLRFLQLLLTDRVPFNDLKNILAITFTHNAASEMKQRILASLKLASMGERKTLDKLKDEIREADDTLVRKAGELVETILDNYSDFQIQTIDSFIARVIQASSLEYGWPLDVELVLDSRALLEKAFALFAAEAERDPSQVEFLRHLIDLVGESRQPDQSFQWLPYEALREKACSLYEQLAMKTGEPLFHTSNISIEELQNQIINLICEIGDVAEASGYKINKRYATIIESARKNDFPFVISKRLTQQVLNQSNDQSFEAYVQTIDAIKEKLLTAVGEYFFEDSIRRYQPYVRMLGVLGEALGQVTRTEAQIGLSTATKQLALSLQLEDIPEIYFSLGEQIHHYLIDEFQDTNPIQWKTLRPLVEHSLGGPGSLFLVGDTKQAIYSFRGGDWRIMAGMIRRDEFPSVPTTHRTLLRNYRSGERILALTKYVFHEIVPKNVEYEEMAHASGLSTFEQVVEEKKKGKGFVSVEYFDPPDRESELIPERDRILNIVSDALNRGYALRDICVLTPRNADVVRGSTWLNAAGIRFLSHSSLDIRTRKLTQEIVALLSFLDSPIDDLSFATLLLGDLFRVCSQRDSRNIDVESFLFNARQASEEPLYVQFRRTYPELWNAYFDRLFSVVGYLPLYDLTAEIYKTFRCYDIMPEEEATLTKLLNVIHTCEQSGIQNVKDFLQTAEHDPESDEWNIAVAHGEDAVTIMTVHKAKGKEFPVVIVLLYDSARPPDSLWIHEAAVGVQLFRMTKDLAEHDPRLKLIVEERAVLDGADALNKLYVALTRAKKELYVLSVKAARGKKPSCWLPESAHQKGTVAKRKGDKRAEQEVSASSPLSHVLTQGIRRYGEEQSIRRAERERGELVHQILEKIHLIDENLEAQVGEIVEKIVREGGTIADPKEIQNTIIETIKLEALRPFFERREGRAVRIEQEIVAPEGDLYRIDRLVIDDDLLTVIDFKTGREVSDHRNQVKRYMELAGNCYPRKGVRGILVYTDLRIVREVT